LAPEGKKAFLLKAIWHSGGKTAFWHNISRQREVVDITSRSKIMSLPQSQPIYTIAEYLALERESDERHEYLDGQIFLMAVESEEHGIICHNLSGQLYNQLRGKPCQTFTKDMKVRGTEPRSLHSIEGFFSYPDLVVVCGERRYSDNYRDVLLNPTLIKEFPSLLKRIYNRPT